MPVNPKAASNVLLYLNPLSGNQAAESQLVSIETYHRLAKQDEANAMNSSVSASANTSDYFQSYYNILSAGDQKELTVSETFLHCGFNNWTKNLGQCAEPVSFVERDARSIRRQRRLLHSGRLERHCLQRAQQVGRCQAEEKGTLMPT